MFKKKMPVGLGYCLKCAVFQKVSTTNRVTYKEQNKNQLWEISTCVGCTVSGRGSQKTLHLQ